MQPVLTDEDAKVVVGKNIERTRLLKGMSRYALAKASKSTTIQISRIERGLHGPGPGLFSRIAEALQVTTDELLATK